MGDIIYTGLFFILRMERFQNTRQPDWDWWGKLWPTPGETLRKLGLSTGETLVEIGSGNGYFTLPAARIVDPATVYALDLDTSLLEELESLAAQQHIDNIVPILGDARSLSTSIPESVDVGLIANTFHGVEDHAALLEEVTLVLEDTGRFIVINWSDLPKQETTIADEPRGPPTELRLSPTETTTIVSEATDLTQTQSIDLPPYHYALVFEK